MLDFRAFMATIGAVVVSCGGKAEVPTDSVADAATSQDSSLAHDAQWGDDVGDSPSCLSPEPQEGSACTQGQTVCPTGDPCCIGYEWGCDPQTGTWKKLGLGCACLDSGLLPDTTADAPPIDATPDAVQPDTAPPVCALQSTSNLPGASIEFTSTECVFTLAQAQAGIDILYNVVVEQDLNDITPHSQVTCGNKPDGTNLLPFGCLTGGNQKYCPWDYGPPCHSDQVGTVKKGVYPGDFHWTGMNFSGPSDTGQKPGPAFPAGDYTLEVSAIGSYAGAPYEVSSTYLVRLLP